jgi:hypothetical protein
MARMGLTNSGIMESRVDDLTRQRAEAAGNYQAQSDAQKASALTQLAQLAANAGLGALGVKQAQWNANKQIEQGNNAAAGDFYGSLANLGGKFFGL